MYEQPIAQSLCSIFFLRYVSIEKTTRLTSSCCRVAQNSLFSRFLSLAFCDIFSNCSGNCKGACYIYVPEKITNIRRKRNNKGTYQQPWPCVILSEHLAPKFSLLLFNFMKHLLPVTHKPPACKISLFLSFSHLYSLDLLLVLSPILLLHLSFFCFASTNVSYSPAWWECLRNAFRFTKFATSKSSYEFNFCVFFKLNNNERKSCNSKSGTNGSSRVMKNMHEVWVWVCLHGFRLCHWIYVHKFGVNIRFRISTSVSPSPSTSIQQMERKQEKKKKQLLPQNVRLYKKKREE